MERLQALPVSRLLNQNNSALFIEEATRRQDYWESGVQARSDFPEFAEWLVRFEIDSISPNPR